MVVDELKKKTIDYYTLCDWSVDSRMPSITICFLKRKKYENVEFR